MSVPPLNPTFSEAVRRADAGDLSGARAIFQSLVDQPELSASCLYQLGLIAGMSGEHARAAGLVSQALQLKPDLWDAYPVLIAALERCARPAEARDAMIRLGCTLEAAGEAARAAEVFRQILGTDPLSYAACFNLGHCLARSQRQPEAAPYLLQAVRLCARVQPEIASLLAAMPECQRDARFAPPYPLPPGPPSDPLDKIENALTSLGSALLEAGYLDASLRCQRMAVMMAPGYALAHWNLSLALLFQNQWQEGWREYEWRWSWPDCPEPVRHLPVPIWRGEPVAGKRVLVWTEQGLGDAMQFVPLAQRLQMLGAEIVLEAPAALCRLFASSFPAFTIVQRPDHPDILSAPGPVDFQVPLMSLAERLQLQPEQLPLARDYLRAPAEVLAHWAQRMPRRARPRVGLVWAGRSNVMPWDAARLPFAEDGVDWYSLQLGPAQAELAAASISQVCDLSAELRDLADTAAAIAQLDLLITIDTGVAHLGGAVGKPVWVLVNSQPNWRWNAADDSVPWYPRMRQFKRAHAEPWQAVMQRVVAALQQWRRSA